MNIDYWLLCIEKIENVSNMCSLMVERAYQTPRKWARSSSKRLFTYRRKLCQSNCLSYHVWDLSLLSIQSNHTVYDRRRRMRCDWVFLPFICCGRQTDRYRDNEKLGERKIDRHTREQSLSSQWQKSGGNSVFAFVNLCVADIRGAWIEPYTMETVFHVRRQTTVSYLFILCILRDMHKYYEWTEKMSTANNASNEFTHHPNSASIS